MDLFTNMQLLKSVFVRDTNHLKQPMNNFNIISGKIWSILLWNGADANYDDFLKIQLYYMATFLSDLLLVSLMDLIMGQRNKLPM